MGFGVLLLAISISVAASLQDVTLRFFPSSQHTESSQAIELKQPSTTMWAPEMYEASNREGICYVM